MWIHRLRRASDCATAVLVASTIFGAACAETIKLGGTGAALGTMRLLADAYTTELRKRLLFAVTDTEAADNQERVPGSLGPSSLTLIASERRALKALALNGVAPSSAALADDSYPLGKSFYLVVGPKPSPTVQSFVDFVRSPPGREILARTEHLAP